MYRIVKEKESKMMRLKQIFWIAAILGLIFNSTFYFQSESAADFHRSAPSPASTIAVKVVTVETSSVIMPENRLPVTAISGNCLAPLSVPSDFLHDQGLINLNQPAGCLSINIAPANASFGQLAVLPLPKPSQQIVMFPTGSFIAAPNLNSSKGIPSSYPLTLPGAALVFAAILAAANEKLKHFTIGQRLNNVWLRKKLFSPFELMVLRC